MKRTILLCLMSLCCGMLLAGCNTSDSYFIPSPPKIVLQMELPDTITETDPTAQASTDSDGNERNEETADTPSEDSNAFDIGSLRAASDANQIITVATANTTTSDAIVTYYKKTSDSTWTEVFSTDGHVGVDGIGQPSEYVSRTPQGMYHFIKAFGCNPDPGCNLPYTKVDANDYWVDDPNSAYYNQFVSADNDDMIDWNSAEHLLGVGASYNYVLALDYNSACVPGAGSAMFLHCYKGIPSEGCITISENHMVTLLQNISPDCVIIIDTKDNIGNY